MSTTSLNNAPPGVAIDTWTAHRPADPAVGDLWLLSWDGQVRGLGVISARLTGFVLVWPVSMPADPVGPPAVMVTRTPLNVPLYPWPSRETGVSDALLHRRFGHLLDPRTMTVTASAFDHGEPPPLPFAPRPHDRANADAYSVDLIDTWAEICFLQWPADGPTAKLDPDTLRKASVTPSIVAGVLGLDGPTAVQVFRGEITLEPEQLEVLASETGIPVDVLLAGGASETVQRLLDPRRKGQVVQVCEHLGIGETQARDLVASHFALAARTSGGTEQRLDGVFARLLAER